MDESEFEFIRGPDGFESRKKVEEANLVTDSL